MGKEEVKDNMDVSQAALISNIAYAVEKVYINNKDASIDKIKEGINGSEYSKHLQNLEYLDSFYDSLTGVRVIIMTVANSFRKSRVLELLPKFKIKKMNCWYAV